MSEFSISSANSDTSGKTQTKPKTYAKSCTKRRKAEQILEKKQQELNYILDSSPTIIFYKDKEGKFIQVNRAFAEALKMPKEKILGKTVFDLYSAKIAQGMANDDFAVLESKRSKLGIIEPYESPTGLRWIRTDKIPSFDENGIVTGLIGFSEDITDRKKAEEALLESEAKYKQLVDRLPEMVFEIDRKGCVVFANSRAFELLGYSKAELEGGFDANRFVAPEDVERSKKNMKRMFAGEMRHSNEYMFVRKDGTRFPVLLNSAPVVKDNKVVGARGTAIDITEQKKEKKALEESEAKLRSIVENSSDQIFMLDRNYKYLSVNKTLADVLGKASKDIVGKSISEVYSPETAAGFLANIKNVFSTGKSLFIEEKMVAQGQGLDISTILNPVQDDMGNVIAVTGIVRDITERKNLERQLQEKERMAVIGQTAGMVGHDLRNPLQSIIGEVYLAKTELKSVPDGAHKTCLQESIQTIGEQVNYMDKIVSDLQTFVKPVEPHRQIVKLKPLIIALLAQTNIPNNIQTNMQIGDVLTIEADPQLLKRVLINLATNSIQAMPHGGKLTIKAHANDSGQVQIIVKDTGVGIPEEIKPKLFTPLFTTKAKGQGFGLAVCKRVLEAQGGTINFESQQGKGTKFIVNLPAKP